MPLSSYAILVQGHFDGVIRYYREARVTDAQWSSFPDPTLQNTLARMRSLMPPQTPLQTHVLHLSKRGEILPHIDNVEASGSIILGVSLGAARVLQLTDDEGNLYSHLVEPGSCYIQW
jgi:alkylated DNA repair protein alkB family protein 7